jgi:hypothetical protein
LPRRALAASWDGLYAAAEANHLVADDGQRQRCPLGTTRHDLTERRGFHRLVLSEA